MRNSRGLGNLSKSLVWEKDLSKGGGDPSIRSEDRRLVLMRLRPLQKGLPSAAVTKLGVEPYQCSNPGTEGKSLATGQGHKGDDRQGQGLKDADGRFPDAARWT